MNQKTKITVVSLGWNKPELTREFVQRLKTFTDIPHQLIFTDNGSDIPQEPIIKKYYPDAFVITQKENIGCPATRNPSMAFVDTELCFWLDNDCMVDDGWYEPILSALTDDEVGIVGKQGYRVKNPWQQPFPFYPYDGDVDYLMGWCMGFKTKAYKPINNYHIPVNLDDVELCFGIKENGLKVVTEEFNAIHKCSHTQRGWNFDDQEKLTELWDNWKDKNYLFEDWK